MSLIFSRQNEKKQGKGIMETLSRSCTTSVLCVGAAETEMVGNGCHERRPVWPRGWHKVSHYVSPSSAEPREEKGEKAFLGIGGGGRERGKVNEVFSSL